MTEGREEVRRVREVGRMWRMSPRGGSGSEEPWQMFLDLLSLPKDPPLHCLSKHNSTYTSVERALSPLVCSHLFIMDKGSWQILIVCIKLDCLRISYNISHDHWNLHSCLCDASNIPERGDPRHRDSPRNIDHSFLPHCYCLTLWVPLPSQLIVLSKWASIR